MNQEFYTTEKIEAYLTNKLSAGEKARFEGGLEKDPLLKNEVSLQQDIINSLNATRKAQLKARLDAIDINSGTGWTAVQWVAATAISALLITGTAVYFNSSSKSDKGFQTNSEIEKTSENAVIAENTVEKPIENNVKPIVTVEENTNEKVVNETKTVEKTINNKVSPGKVNNEELKNDIVPVLPDLARFDDENEIRNNNNSDAPQDKLVEKTNNEVKNIETKIIEKKLKTIEYIFNNNKLFLFGDFEKKPYQILDYNTGKTRQLYLYFENNYFKLEPTKNEPVPVKFIKDQDFIKILESIRVKK